MNIPDIRPAIVHAGVRILMGRTKLRTAEDTRRDVHATSLRPASFNPPPSPLLPGVRLSADRTRGFPVFTIEPDSGRYGKTVIDFHGGAYVREIVSFHWLFARTITVAASVRLLLPIYPLAPHRTAARTVADAADIVESAISTQGAGNVAVVGDSAGGGIALAAAQELKRRGAPQPSRLILLSPWLDVTMSDPAQATIEKRDILLARGGLKEAGRLYAGDLEVTDWRVSPLFGDLTGLAPMSVYTGTHDILVTDSRALTQRARDAGATVDYTEEIGMQHDYALFPLIRQAHTAREDIARILRA
ncbi:alpha/beta hydrolase fold domain-containing protein [Rhodococcus sp. ACPA1]|uniref:alpha/beta hydrolase fold domain-containing protein n=1 Tax=Rhodococcus sp. ACPA1 TaxID=2028572 RepID=UPI0027BAA6EF|nr:alpha/beta hydrolase fold domain-containing protein [Rhodococcus sp. ACPA1]